MDKFKRLNFFAFLSLFLSSASVFFVPWANFDENLGSRKLAILVAALFWLGIVFGIVFELMAKKERKKLEDIKYGKNFFFVFKNKESLFSFVIMILSFVGIIVFKSKTAVVTICLFLLILSFYLFLLFSGKNYRALRRFNKSKQVRGENNEN